MAEIETKSGIGHLYEDALLVSVHVGSARLGGEDVELLHGTTFSPMVHCARTNRTFALDWEQVVRLAQDAGLFDGADDDDGARRA